MLCLEKKWLLKREGREKAHEKHVQAFLPIHQNLKNFLWHCANYFVSATPPYSILLISLMSEHTYLPTANIFSVSCLDKEGLEN